MNKLLFALIASFLSRPALAVGFALTPPPGDISTQILAFLFPGALDSLKGGASGPTDTIGHMLSSFNVGIMILGSILLGYTLLVSIVNTANNGQMLGKWNAAWTPLRIFGSIAMIIPMPSGYAAIQVLTLWFAVNGIGLADNVWNAAVQGIEKTGSIVATPPSDSSQVTAQAIMRSLVCEYAVNQAYTLAGFPEPVQSTSTVSNGTVQLTWGGKPGANSGLSPTVCGGLTLKSTADANSAQKTEGGLISGNIVGDAFKYVFVDTTDAQNQIANAKNIALAQMMLELAPTALQIARGTSLPEPGAIGGATFNYDRMVKAAIAGAVQSLGNTAETGFAANAAKDGWITSGAMYPRINALNDKVATASSNQPVPLAMHLDELGPTMASDVAPIISKVDTYFRLPAKTGLETQAENESDWHENPLDFVANKMGQKIIAGLTTMGNGSWLPGPSTVSGLTQIKNVGDYLLSSANFGLMTYLGLKFAAGATDGEVNSIPGMIASTFTGGALTAGAKGFASVLSAVGPFLTIAILALWTLGGTLSVLLPLLPLTIWIGSLVSYFAILCEALIATPLWMALHIKGDEGEHFAHSGVSQGYSFILGATLRPVLMVFGLVFSTAIMLVMSKLATAMFMTAFAGIQVNSTTGLITIIFAMIAYCGMMHSLVARSFSLIQTMPDTILRWFSAGSSQSDDMERRVQQETSGGAGTFKAGLQQSAKPTSVKPRNPQSTLTDDVD